MRRTLGLALALVLAGALVAPAQDAGARAEADLAEAKRLFEALDYERAVPALDRAVVALEGLALTQASARPQLSSAYEMRARARFGLGDLEGARNDFRALLGVDPAFAFAGQVSPRVVALLEEVRALVVATLALAVDPADATVELNGQPVVLSGQPIALKAAEYSIKLSRVGYKPLEETVVLVAGEPKQLTLVLERVDATVFLVTSPPDVEVLVNGVSRGRSASGPPTGQYAEVPNQLGVAPDAVSKPLVLTDLTPGAYTVTFKRDCHVSEERRLVIEALADYRVEPVRLRRAVASVNVESVPAGANVFVDGEPRGVAPLALDDICEGPRTVELRGAQGRYVQRLDARPGEQFTVKGSLKPAFALLPGTSTGVADIRPTIERALGPSRRVTVFVPSARQVEEATRGMNLPADWLSFDAGRRPLGGAATLNGALRREISARLARALDTQGVAAVTPPSPTSPEYVLSLLAAGAGEPDVVPVLVDRVDSVRSAVARFDFVPPLFKLSVGLTPAEVLDSEGLVVVRVEPGSAADQAGIRPGDTLVKADGQVMKEARQWRAVLDARRAGESVAVEISPRAGGVRQAQLAVTAAPRVLGAADQTLLFNPLTVSLRTQLAAAPPDEQPIVRLNLGIALLRLGDFAGAREQLAGVQLPAGPGVAHGTVQYLLGLALEGLGDAAGAQKAWQAAAASEAWLTEDGPPVKGLAERKLGGSGAPAGTP